MMGIFGRNKEFESLKSTVDKMSEENTTLVSDIDKFKNINDTYGHGVGDEVLKELALIVQKQIREYDLFARWGGEEFVLVTTKTDIVTAEKIAEKIRLAIEKHTFPEVKKVTASFGLSCAKNEFETFEAILEKADKGLYQAKETGRNKVYCW